VIISQPVNKFLQLTNCRYQHFVKNVYLIKKFSRHICDATVLFMAVEL
jgi:hypothetical protein